MNNEFNISKIFVSNIAPANTAKGKLWLDTSLSPSQLKESNGTSWINCGATVTIDGVTLSVENVIENIGLELESKANDTSVVHKAGDESISGNKTFTGNSYFTNNTIYIGSGYPSDGTFAEYFHINRLGIYAALDMPDMVINTGLNGVLKAGTLYLGEDYIAGIDKESNHSDLSDPLNASDHSIPSSQLVATALSSKATYEALELKQDKTDDTLNTTSKTIVGAINELNTKLLADVPAPITNVFTSTSTSLTSIITDSTKANIQGKILISPNINNLGAVYVGQSITDKSTAFPLYPNQIVSFSFTDITNFKVATDVIGDKFNYVIEFGILNAAVSPAEGLIISGTDGSKYRLNPSGAAGSETFTLTKIS